MNCVPIHDEVSKWKQFLSYWPFVRAIRQLPVDFPHKDHWRGALVFSRICAWTNGWANSRDALDLGHHGAHCDVTIMLYRGNGSNHFRRQAINGINDDLLSVGDTCGIRIKIFRIHLKEMHLNTSATKWHSFCSAINVLSHWMNTI